MSQQGRRQASVRAATGTALTYEGDWHALFDQAGIAAGTYDERLLRWINGRLSASYGDLNGAMQAFAAVQGAANWASMGAFEAGGVGFQKVAMGLPLLAIGDSQINYGNGSSGPATVGHAMMGITSQAHAHDPRWNNDVWYDASAPNGIYANGMNRGVAGQTSAQVVARIAAETAKRCPVWLLEGGINDGGLANTLSNLTNGVDILAQNADVKAVIVMNIPPWGASYVNSADRQVNYSSVNLAIKAMVVAKQTAYPIKKIALLDAAVLCGINPITYAWQSVAQTGSASFVYRNDYLHWSTYMAYVICENPLGTPAKGLTEILSEIYEAGDFYEALATSGTQILSANGSKFIGSTKVPTGRFSGSVPTSLTPAGGTNTSIVCSVEANGETGGNSAVFKVTPGGTLDEQLSIVLIQAANRARFTGSIAGDVLTVNTMSDGPYKDIQPGDMIAGQPGVTANSSVQAYGTGGTTGTGGAGTYKLSQPSSQVFSNLNATTPLVSGDWYRFLVELEFDAWPYWGGCSIQLDQDGDTTNTLASAGNFRLEGDGFLTSCKYPVAEKQKFATPPMQLSGTPTQLTPVQFKLEVRNSGATGTGVFKIHRMRVFKTASPLPAFNM